MDLKEGRCVRLYQGNFNEEVVYSENPVEVALEWQAQGAPRLHIIDLDGAASGQLCNLEIIKQIASAMLIPTQVGGGVRRMETVEQLLKAGVERVILGTVAVEDPELVKAACRKFSESIVVSLDAREGYIATHGWLQDTGLTVVEIARSLANVGVRRFIYTDISRDGTLTEPNFAGIFELLSALRQPVIASGGVTTLNHLKMLKSLGVEGAIVGKALYAGDIRLKQAIRAIC